MAKLSIRIDFGKAGALGPGKARVLELVAETGSIRKAAAAMKMSYRKAWLLLQALEATFGAAMTVTATGGRAGGGAQLTPLGQQVLSRYRAIEAVAAKSARGDLTALSVQAKSRRSAAKKSRPKS